MKNFLSKWWALLLNLMLGGLNIWNFIYGTHNPWALFSAGFCFGAAMGLFFNEKAREMYLESNSFHRSILTKQQAYITELERILNEVAAGRATISKKEPARKTVN